MLYYFWGNQHLYCFYFEVNKTKWQRFAYTDNFKNNLTSFIGFFEAPKNISNNILSYNDTAFGLYENLSLKKIIKQKNTIIIPDGLLNFVSFDALVTQKTKLTNFKQIPYLLKQNKIGFCSNATLFLQENKATKNQKTAGFFPVFANTNYELKHTLKELEKLKEQNATIFKNELATKQNFLKNCGNYDVLHIARHTILATTIRRLCFLMMIDYCCKNCMPCLIANQIWLYFLLAKLVWANCNKLKEQ